MNQPLVVPNTLYTLSDLSFLLGISYKEVKKEMKSRGYKIDGGGYQGEDVISAGLGILNPGFEMPKKVEEKPKELIHGFEPYRLYTLSEISDILGMGTTTIVNRLIQAGVRNATTLQQEQAGFKLSITRYYGKDAALLVKKPNKLKDIPVKSVNNRFLEKAVEGMGVDSAQALLTGFTTGLEKGTI